MTTVAYRDGVIVADSMITVGNEKRYINNKVFSTKFFVVGVSGEIAYIPAIKKWLEENEADFTDINQMLKAYDSSPIKDKDIGLLLVDRNRKIYMSRNGEHFIPIKGPFETLGSGGDYARGAMAAGMTAEDAVKVARKYDPYTGGRLHKAYTSQLCS